MGSAKQRISGALILTLGASMLVGCELPERNTQVKSIKIGVTLYDQYDAFLSELMEDFNTYAAAKEEETGIAINVEVYNASQSQATQNNQVEAMAQDGCDIICVNLVDRTDPTTVIDLAEKNDIPVIFFNRELVEEDLERWDKLYYVGAKAFESGMMEGQIAKVITKPLDKLGLAVNEVEQGNLDANFNIHGTIEVEKLGYAIANWNRAQAQNKMTQLLSQNGNKIELVIANNDDMAVGAIDALKASDLSREEWPVVVGIDGTDVGLEAVKNGEMVGTVYNDKEGQAKGMLELSFALATGGNLEDLNLEDGKYIRMPYAKVGPDDVDEYLDR